MYPTNAARCGLTSKQTLAAAQSAHCGDGEGTQRLRPPCLIVTTPSTAGVLSIASPANAVMPSVMVRGEV
jgi:hypothetical protein